MNVVVAGGTGFLGRALVSSLLADGHVVTVLSRRPTPTLPGGAQSAVWLSRAGHGDGAWRRTVYGADAVINLAGAPLAERRWSAAHKHAIAASRVEATAALVQALAASSPRPPVLVSASAVGYYGPLGDEPVTEAAPAGRDFLAGVCAAWEAEALAARDLGVRVVVLRTGLVLGRHGGALARLVAPFRLFAGGPLGDGRQWMPWIHIDDAVGIIRHAIERDAVMGAVHLTAPEPVRNRTFARTLGQVLGRPAALPVPAFALRLALGEMAQALLLSGQRAVPEAALRAGYAFRHDALHGALEELLG